MQDMKKYYAFRKAVRNLYQHDTIYGDLCGSLLYIRDKNRCINAMSIDIPNYNIEVEFDGNIDAKKFEKIINDILVKISSFMWDNIDNIVSFSFGEISREDAESIITYNPFCDTSIIGKTLTIIL